MLDIDEDFQPVRNIGPDVFKALRRLHTCDISAWSSGIHDLRDPHPKKAVHWRRSCHIADAGVPGPPADKIRDILVSRLDSSHQGGLPKINRFRISVELGNDDGVFEGDDAEDTRLGHDADTRKSEFHPSLLGRTSRRGGDRVWLWRGYPVDY